MSVAIGAEPPCYHKGDRGIHVLAGRFVGCGDEKVMVCVGDKMEGMSSLEDVGPVCCVCDRNNLSLERSVGSVRDRPSRKLSERRPRAGVVQLSLERVESASGTNFVICIG
jgi:hypothetical protein